LDKEREFGRTSRERKEVLAVIQFSLRGVISNLAPPNFASPADGEIVAIRAPSPSCQEF
jgi:hypothetical protein